MRLSELWERLRLHTGERYAETYARDQVIGGLQGRTITEALSDGEDVRRVWRAVWVHLELPESER